MSRWQRGFAALRLATLTGPIPDPVMAKTAVLITRPGPGHDDAGVDPGSGSVYGDGATTLTSVSAMLYTSSQSTGRGSVTARGSAGGTRPEQPMSEWQRPPCRRRWGLQGS